jgi:hypothetical protein
VGGGDYTVLAKGSGRILFKIDGNNILEKQLHESECTVLGSLRVNAGAHDLEVLASSEDQSIRLDALLLLRTESVGEPREHGPTENSSRILRIQEIDATKFVIELDAGQEIMLCSSQAYNPAWAASFDGHLVKSSRVFGAVNGFWIAMSNRTVVTVELQPQQLFYVGVDTSISTLLVCSICVFIGCRRRKLGTVSNRQPN